MNATQHVLPLCAALGMMASALTFTPALAQPAGATLDHCRETAGRAFVTSCMQSGGGSLETCRAKAAPAIRRCMASAGGMPAAKQATAGPDTGKAKLVILMPGAGGATPSDFLVRNKGQIGGADVSVVVTTSAAEAASLSQGASAKNRKVVLVGMSRGSIDVANALAAGARASGVVLVSGAYDKVRASLGAPSRLPATLLVHHRDDGCQVTPPAAVSSFVAWSGGRASARWIDNRGTPVPNPCGPRGAHGFFMQDGAAVSAINGFIAAR